MDKKAPADLLWVCRRFLCSKHRCFILPKIGFYIGGIIWYNISEFLLYKQREKQNKEEDQIGERIDERKNMISIN